MDKFLVAAIELLPALVDKIKEAIEQRDAEEAKAFLEAILGSSPENKISIQMAISKLKAEKQLV